MKGQKKQHNSFSLHPQDEAVEENLPKIPKIYFSLALFAKLVSASHSTHPANSFIWKFNCPG
jgi:hypothetical protein